MVARFNCKKGGFLTASVKENMGIVYRIISTIRIMHSFLESLRKFIQHGYSSFDFLRFVFSYFVRLRRAHILLSTGGCSAVRVVKVFRLTGQNKGGHEELRLLEVKASKLVRRFQRYSHLWVWS